MPNSQPARAATRRPQARSLRNTALMVDAATSVFATHGWAGCTLAEVARRMGTSEGPVRTRVTGRTDLGTLVWQGAAGAELEDSVISCLDALGPARAGDPEPLIAALLDMAKRCPERDAAAELLVQAHFDPAVASVIRERFGVRAAPYLDGTAPAGGASAARNGYVVALALGILLSARARRAHLPGMADAIATRVRALQSDRTPMRLPSDTATHMDIRPVLAPEDPALDALLMTTLELVGQYGFDGVSVRTIAHEADCTEGLIYGRFESKLDMYITATRLQNKAGWQLNHDFNEALVAKVGLGGAEAVFMREALLPSRAIARAMALEQTRLGWHYPVLAQTAAAELEEFRAALLADPKWAAMETESDFHLNVAISLGAYALPLIAPEACTLPFDVVTVPLFEILEARFDG